MLSILDLPPELLLGIFSHAIFNSPSLEHENHLERTRYLLSFSLVHRQWTSIAQEVLLKEVWVGDTNYRDGAIERKGRQLVEARVNGTKYLTVEGDIEALLRVTGSERWNGLVYLKDRPKYAFRHSTRFDTFFQFSNLETLNLSHANFLITRFDPSLNPVLPKLRRLIFSLRPLLKGDLEDIQKVFSSAQMPNLTHLAFGSPVHPSFTPSQVFGSVSPHITTLAIRDSLMDYPDSAPLRVIGRCSKLKHLSLYIGNRDLESLLFPDAAGLELESLHLSALKIGDSSTLLPRLAKLAKGETETIKVKRVVFYGEEESLNAIRPDVADDDVFEWGDRDSPPFEDFDGR